MPSFSMSREAFCITWSEKESRSVLIFSRVNVPMISRMLPWRESRRSRAMSGALLVQEVLGRQPDALLLRGDADLGHGVHGDVDEVVGGDGLLGLDVHGHLAQVQLIQPLQKGDADASLPNEDAAVFPQAGDDVRLVRRGFHIAQKQDDDNDQDRDEKRKVGQ